MKQSEFLRTCLERLEAAGWRSWQTTTSEHEDRPIDCPTIEKVLIEVQSVDDCFILLNAGEGWIRVVWQGPDETYPYAAEVISDYTINLDPTIENLMREVED